jgi:hypothetical protein
MSKLNPEERLFIDGALVAAVRARPEHRVEVPSA